MLIKPSQREEAPTVELTPIIDMVFLLLIFFLVATTYQQSEREMKIALPDAEAAGPITMQLREIVVNVTTPGEVFVSGRRVTLDELRQIIGDAVASNPAQKVSVRGDRNAAYGAVARVLDVCKAAGVSEPFLDTVPLP